MGGYPGDEAKYRDDPDSEVVGDVASIFVGRACARARVDRNAKTVRKNFSSGSR